MELYVVVSTNYNYKPSHMDISCDGLLRNWNDALRTGLYISQLRDDLYAMTEDEIVSDHESDHESECEDEKFGDNDKKYIPDEDLPTSRSALAEMLPENGYVRDFKAGERAEWWDGSDLGSRLVSIRRYFVV